MTQLRIKEICSEKDISIIELSSRIGMSRVSISNMIAGRQSPPVDTLEKIANALGVEVWTLLKDPKDVGAESTAGEHLSCPKCGARFKLTEVK